jgi:small nuclear ribonucleoprotein (snRNP)-like protein
MNLVLEDVEEMHVKVIIYNFTENWEVSTMGHCNRPLFHHHLLFFPNLQQAIQTHFKRNVGKILLKGDNITLIQQAPQ